MADLLLEHIPDQDKKLEDWKNEFAEILKIVPDLKITDLKKHDSHFGETTGAYDFHNAKRGKTSVDKIKPIIMAARLHLNEKQLTTVNPDQIRLKQRLMPS